MGVSFTSFIDELYGEIAEFRKFWSRGNFEDPEGFPMEMEPGEWDEQFRAWLDIRSED